MLWGWNVMGWHKNRTNWRANRVFAHWDWWWDDTTAIPCWIYELRGCGFSNFDCFNSELDFDFFANQHATRFKSNVPAQAEVFTVDFGACFKTRTHITEGAVPLTKIFNFERNR